MRHLVIGQRQKAPNFSAFHWSPHGCLITIGQHFVTTRVVHLPKRTKTSLITNRTKAELITSYCNYGLSAQPGPIRTRLCGPCIAAKAGFCPIFTQGGSIERIYKTHILALAISFLIKKKYSFYVLQFKINGNLFYHLIRESSLHLACSLETVTSYCYFVEVRAGASTFETSTPTQKEIKSQTD